MDHLRPILPRWNDQEKLNNTEYLCRICLTQSNKMVALTSKLNNKETCSPQIVEVLEKVMSLKVMCDSPFPTTICPMCLGLLKISYDLKIQFESSQKTLQEKFKDTVLPASLSESNVCVCGAIWHWNAPLATEDTETNKTCKSEPNELSPVEIIVGPNKYDLKDIIIVEEVKHNQEEFKGFLDNLGKSVTAKFANEDRPDKKTEEDPVVLIEKINNTKDVICNNNRLKQEITDGPAFENLDRFIIVQEDDDAPSENGANIIYENINLEVFGLKNPTEADQELFKSALNIQLKCPVCQKLYATRGRLKRHLKTCGKQEYQIQDDKNGVPTISPASALLGCQICSRTFKERKFLNYHIKTDHNAEPSKLTCKVCGHVARNRNAHVYHRLTRHGERKYVCDICGKKFFTSGTLKTHTLNHNQSTQCVCPVCGKTFHYKGGLFYHMKQHTNERKYCCEYCDRKFYTLMALKRHTLTHTGIRPYACKFCEKKFFSTGELRKHEYLHTGHRPFRCQYCKKGFSSSYNLKVHLVSHPGSFSCQLCDRAFINGSVLRFHNRTKHGITE